MGRAAESNGRGCIGSTINGEFYIFACLRTLCGLAIAACLLSGCGPTSSDRVGSTGERLTVVCGAPAGGPVQGIDVSHFQGSINWSSVRANGVVFAYASIGDGTGFQDPLFDANWINMRNAGVLRGAYLFFEPGEDEVVQANLMIGKVGRLGDGDLPCMIDVEVTGGQSGATIAAKVARLISLVRQGTGKQPVIYTGPFFWQNNVNAASFGNVPLWIADYGVSCPLIPNGWSSWSLWQYSDGNGQLDHDVLNGDVNALRRLGMLGGPNCAGLVDGLYCGNDGLGGDANTLYRCTGGNASVVQVCASGCQTMPAGINDLCKSGGANCAGQVDGLYCGSDGLGGDANTLYRCTGGNASVAQVCAGGCQTMPPGINDNCR
jgi:GH25 family lysozyme M1 (1,4-beta-N-acetylmuramidase)